MDVDQRKTTGRKPGGRVARLLRAFVPWVVQVGAALACVAYLDLRTQLVPKWGQWYAADEHPFVLLQVRAFLSGRLALFRHPSGAVHDTDWGRRGVHTNFGLGDPILATPLHLLARLFGAPGFPDNLRFLVFYGLTTLALTRALYLAGRRERGAVVVSAVAAAFVMAFPTFVGFLSARFLTYEQVIATGTLWSVLLLSGVLALRQRCTAARFVVVCAAAGFSILIRPPLAVYGATTVALAVVLAGRSPMRRWARVAGLAAYAGVTASYFAGNALRFGSPWNTGYANIDSVAFVNRLTRWGVSFAHVPLTKAIKELFVMTFLLEPVTSDAMAFTVPSRLVPYAVGERWREYYSPTFDMVVLAIWIAALGIVAVKVARLVRGGPRGGVDVVTITGAWALLPSIALFFFYARIGNIVTRYLIDLYPAFAAAGLCVAMAVVDVVRMRAPRGVWPTRLAIAAAVSLYFAGARTGWLTKLSEPADRETIVARVAEIDARSADLPDVGTHFVCNGPHGKDPVYNHLAEWEPSCTFHSGMVFAMRHRPCVTFTFRAGAYVWGPEDDEALAGFRATADFDSLVACAPASIDEGRRRLTMCEQRPPAFLLDGLRLYSVASLDANLVPIDRLGLMQIDGVTSCQ